MNPKPDNSFEFIRVIFRKRVFILIFTGVVTLGTAFFSGPYFITPMYDAEVIIYPPSTNSNQILINRDVRFGSDKEIDEQIQLLSSSIVRDSVIDKYDLYRHYKIDTSASDKKYRIIKEFNNSVKIERTRYNSISVTATDQDPELAAALANDIVAIGDNYKETIIKQKLQEAFDALAKNIFDLSQQIDATAEEINEFYKKKVVGGVSFTKKTSIDQLKEKLDIKELLQSARQSDQVKLMEKIYFYESKLQQLETIQISYDQALVILSSRIPSSFIISPATPADKKSSPVRWIITLFAAASSFIVSVALSLLLEKLPAMAKHLREEK